MKMSINSIKGLNRRYGCADDIAPHGVDDVVEKIGTQLGAVEAVVDIGSKYKDVLIAKIVSVADHPNADRLHVCKIDDGGKAKNVERDESGLVQVVCGAPNVREGMLVAWLPPGVTVPESLGKDPFVLEARALRGVVSNGMLASPRELAIGDKHEGILEVDALVEPGTAFAEAYDLAGDVVIDIENKMFTHRPDCFGFLGISRELAGIQHLPFKSPDWYKLEPDFPGVEAEPLPLEVRNELPELVPRFSAITMRDVQVGESPVWLQIELAKVGLRSVNNIVDYTNFFMLETGQPLHAYDYDKVAAQDEAETATIVVRHPNKSEKMALLNGKEIEPRAEAIMIATEQKLIGVGGVMGGGETEVDEHTKNIIIECANFDMYSIRRTAMAHGLFTDAVTRNNKGQSPLQNLAVLAKIVDEIRRFAGGKVASKLIDDNHVAVEALERGTLQPPVAVSRDFINTRLGLTLPVEQITQLLANVEFTVDAAPKPKRVILLHGRSKSPGQAWYPWLKETCQEQHIQCETPQMPHADAPVLAEWLKVIDDLRPDSNTVLVGHSRGGMAILRWLEQAPAEVKVKKVILVAANHPSIIDAFGGDFYEGNFPRESDYDYEKIKQHCHEFVVFHSRDDDFVAFAAGQKNAKGLNAKFRAYDGLQHFGNNITRMQTIFDEVVDQETLRITAPFWRTDIELPEDIVEEVGRLYGYDRLPLVLPRRDTTPTAQNRMLALKTHLRNTLVRAGANEVLTYSFVHGNLLDKMGQNRDQAFRLGNALSPDLQYFRLSLTPSLLANVHSNLKAGYGEFAMFEFGTTHTVAESDTDGLPREAQALSFVCAANDRTTVQKYGGAAYYQARHYVQKLLQDGNVASAVQFESLEGADLYGNPRITQMVAPFEPNRSAVLRDNKGLIWGIVGEFKASVRKALKLPGYTAGFELDPLLFLQQPPSPHYLPLPRFPSIEQDICLKVPAETTYQQVFETVWDSLSGQEPDTTFCKLSPVDIYQRPDDHKYKQVTLRLHVASYERTLTDDEVNKLLAHAAEQAKTALQAERI